jgi:hypothetical protein
MDKLEKEMRRAFGMDSFVKAKQTAVGSSWYMRVSVRKSLGGAPDGPVFVYENTYPTISAFDAEMRMRKEVRQKGYIVWVILDSCKAEDK